jgi:transposase-like protein
MRLYTDIKETEDRPEIDQEIKISCPYCKKINYIKKENLIGHFVICQYCNIIFSYKTKKDRYS